MVIPYSQGVGDAAVGGQARPGLICCGPFGATEAGRTKLGTVHEGSQRNGTAVILHWPPREIKHSTPLAGVYNRSVRRQGVTPFVGQSPRKPQ